MIINAENIILGRLASFTAKKLLLGEKVIIVNCEKAVISGSKRNLLERYTTRMHRGAPRKGPIFPRRADSIVRITIKRMLPYKKPRGREAFKNLKCYIGIPQNVNTKEIKEIPELEKAKSDKLPNVKFMSLKELSKLLGAKE
ncbi:50S ribosomal protein L13 [Candidatus Woesearchaeota archaeon ex4484_78]|nr:MAG: 50S ribosomal protein L13 [Candidatus Woesearchaeota archaeon ex4484_78]